MAKSPTEQIQELKATIAEMNAKVQVLSEKIGNAEKNVDQLLSRVNDLSTKVARVEERCTSLGKNTDRGWNLTQAIIILGLSVGLSALTSFLVQSLLKKP